MASTCLVLFCVFLYSAEVVGQADNSKCPSTSENSEDCPRWFTETGAQLSDSRMNLGSLHNLNCLRLVEKNCGVTYVVYTLDSEKEMVKILVTYTRDHLAGPKVYYLYSELVPAHEILGYDPPK